MALTVCLAANTLYYPQGGGHRWVYLNWALGLKGLGCEVLWMEEAEPHRPPEQIIEGLAALRSHLQPYGMAERVALCSTSPGLVASAAGEGVLGLEAAGEADLLVNFRYGLPAEVVRRFRRSVLVDIDPGLLQLWMSRHLIELPPHHLYVTTSEAVAEGNGRIPDVGITWRHLPPCVALDWWPVRAAPAGAPFTTISHWGTNNEWVDDGRELYCNDKQAGFEPFLELPQRVERPLELALCLSVHQEQTDAPELRRRGWRVRQALGVASSPAAYQRYIQRSYGELSCVKPSCVRLQNAWVSDRTLCYLASGKPAIVQHTVSSRLLPDGLGLYRFRDLEEAAGAVRTVVADYERQCRLARQVAEEHFDARIVAARLLEEALS